MDFEESKKAFKRAEMNYEKYYSEPTPSYPKLKNHGIEQKSVEEFPNGYGYPSNYVAPEVDYAIVKIENGYLVARSHRLGSLNYETVCICQSQHEAQTIVKALSK